MTTRGGLLGAALVGAALASAVTLGWSGAFPDPFPPEPFNAVLAEARGWSAVTLGLAVPLGVWALAKGESLRGRLAGTGVAAYLLYTYLEFATAPPFTALYLVYVATFALALWALVAGVASVDPTELEAAVGPAAPRRGIIAYGVVIALGLTLAWGKDIVTRTLGGDFGYPTGAAAVGHVVHALDLGLQVPLGLAAAALLARRSHWGWLVAAILLVQGACMAAALVAMVGTSLVLQGQPLVGVAPFAALFLVSAGLLAALGRAVRDGLPERGRST